MQAIAPNVLKSLQDGLDARFLTNDPAVDQEVIPFLAGFDVVEQRVEALRDPLAIARVFSLRSKTIRTRSLELTLSLALRGPSDALMLLELFIGGFERLIPFDRALLISKPPLLIGNAGLAWAWKDGNQVDVAAFLSGNLLVVLRGSRDADLISIARQVDGALKPLDLWTDDPRPNPYFRVRESPSHNPVTVAAGGTVIVRAPEAVGASSFAVLLPAESTGAAQRRLGSVTRGPGRDEWSYHAEFGPDRMVNLLILGMDGIVPHGVRFTIDVKDQG